MRIPIIIAKSQFKKLTLGGVENFSNSFLHLGHIVELTFPPSTFAFGMIHSPQ